MRLNYTPNAIGCNTEAISTRIAPLFFPSFGFQLDWDCSVLAVCCSVAVLHSVAVSVAVSRTLGCSVPPDTEHHCCSLPASEILRNILTHRSVQIRMKLSGTSHNALLELLNLVESFISATPRNFGQIFLVPVSHRDQKLQAVPQPFISHYGSNWVALCNTHLFFLVY